MRPTSCASVRPSRDWPRNGPREYVEANRLSPREAAEHHEREQLRPLADGFQVRKDLVNVLGILRDVRHRRRVWNPALRELLDRFSYWGGFECDRIERLVCERNGPARCITDRLVRDVHSCVPAVPSRHTHPRPGNRQLEMLDEERKQGVWIGHDDVQVIDAPDDLCAFVGGNCWHHVGWPSPHAARR